MLYAYNTTHDRILATPQAIGICPSCNQSLIAKCGHINIWHWSHRTKEPLCNYQPETEWHMQWKQTALNCGNDIEVRIGNHITDILNNNNNRLIELQNSSINVGDIIDRCEVFKHYGFMVDWIFNRISKYENEQLYFTRKEKYWTFKQKWQKKLLRFLFNDDLYPKYGRVWFDIGESHPLFLIRKLYSSGGGWGKFAARFSPIYKIRYVVVD
uniref:Putative competence protein CoiA-like family protein n=1 Tax=viral metagenome TaxID=1070528 RepID=A0A6M3Y5I1_9ZZZZ